MDATQKPKRIDIVPGAKLLALPGLTLDAHMTLFGKAKMLVDAHIIDIVTKPRRSKDNTNLVCVRLDNVEYEVFYCDVLKFTRKVQVN